MTDRSFLSQHYKNFCTIFCKQVCTRICINAFATLHNISARRNGKNICTAYCTMFCIWFCTYYCTKNCTAFCKYFCTVFCIGAIFPTNQLAQTTARPSARCNFSAYLSARNTAQCSAYGLLSALSYQQLRFSKSILSH